MNAEIGAGTGQRQNEGGRLWTCVRDDRPAGSEAASAVWFADSPDRKGEHPAAHLKNYRGILQADGFAGFNRLYETGAILEAACWAHVRRTFFDLHLFDLHHGYASPVAKEVLDAEKQIFFLRFRKTGDVYRYFRFPAAEYHAFVNASRPLLPRSYPRQIPLRTHGETPRRLICHGLARLFPPCKFRYWRSWTPLRLRYRNAPIVYCRAAQAPW